MNRIIVLSPPPTYKINLPFNLITEFLRPGESLSKPCSIKNRYYSLQIYQLRKLGDKPVEDFKVNSKIFKSNIDVNFNARGNIRKSNFVLIFNPCDML